MGLLLLLLFLLLLLLLLLLLSHSRPYAAKRLFGICLQPDFCCTRSFPDSLRIRVHPTTPICKQDVSFCLDLYPGRLLCLLQAVFVLRALSSPSGVFVLRALASPSGVSS